MGILRRRICPWPERVECRVWRSGREPESDLGSGMVRKVDSGEAQSGPSSPQRGEVLPSALGLWDELPSSPE